MRFLNPTRGSLLYDTSKGRWGMTGPIARVTVSEEQLTFRVTLVPLSWITRRQIISCDQLVEIACVKRRGFDRSDLCLKFTNKMGFSVYFKSLDVEGLHLIRPGCATSQPFPRSATNSQPPVARWKSKPHPSESAHGSECSQATECARRCAGHKVRCLASSTVRTAWSKGPWSP